MRPLLRLNCQPLLVSLMLINIVDLLTYKKSGNMKQAIREMGRVKNPILKGHVLAQRYLHPTAWRSSYKELSEWLAHYNDHPDASRIYWLAKRRKPKKLKSNESKTQLLKWIWTSWNLWICPRVFPPATEGAHLHQKNSISSK